MTSHRNAKLQQGPGGRGRGSTCGRGFRLKDGGRTPTNQRAEWEVQKKWGAVRAVVIHAFAVETSGQSEFTWR